jgi:signal transduction histidine kinase
LKSLYLRIWLTVVAVLALFALVSGWMWQHHVEQERVRLEAAASERLAAWAELVQRSLPSADTPIDDQAYALRDWSVRLRVPLALDDRRGMRIAASESFLRREAEGAVQATAVRLDDGRTLWLARRRRLRAPDAAGYEDPQSWRNPGGGAPLMRSPRGPHLGESAVGPALGERPPPMPPMQLFGGLTALPLGLPQALGPLVLVALLFVAVAAGAYPVVRRLTRRLEALKQGVESFGSGNLAQRVDAAGSDEVAAVAATFNLAAERIETLVKSHQNLLANASHELRSPLARLKMAVAMYGELPEAQRAGLQREINTNVAELDALVEEVLLASRLDAGAAMGSGTLVDVLSIAAEEASRVDAEVSAGPQAQAWVVMGSDRLLRRALRNLLENARRYGGGEISAEVLADEQGRLRVNVCDRGAGVLEELRERIFEPFFRMPGHAEREGGVGLGLSLVRQIAQRHGGTVHCEAREGGGSCFVLNLPATKISGPQA